MFWYVFLTGLLMAQYTMTGYDASAHVAEETHQASRSAAVGMYMSVVASVFFGFILLVAVTLALPADPTIDLYIIPTSWVAAMGQSWADVPPLHLLRSSVLLPHGIDDIRVADAVRLLA